MNIKFIEKIGKMTKLQPKQPKERGSKLIKFEMKKKTSLQKIPRNFRELCGHTLHFFENFIYKQYIFIVSTSLPPYSNDSSVLPLPLKFITSPFIIIATHSYTRAHIHTQHYLYHLYPCIIFICLYLYLHLDVDTSTSTYTYT